MAINLGTAVAYLDLDTSKFTKGFSSAANDLKVFGDKTATAGKKIDGLSSAMGVVGGTMTRGVTVPLLAIGTAAVTSSVKWETAWTGVTKTVNGTEKQMKSLEKGLFGLSRETASSAVEIAGVAEAAGQLGIKTDDILGFTKTMIQLGDTTNLSAEEAASSLAKFANVTGMSQKDFDKLGSTIVDLGNNFATTEADIVAMGTRLAGAGTQVGLSESQIMSFAAALSSVGIEAEAGGSAFSKVMSDMQLAVETGSGKLEEFASVAGMSAEQFSVAFKDDAAGAINAFIKGLGESEKKGVSAIKVLDDMGIKEIRMRDALLRAAGASDVFSEALSVGTNAWEENIALTEEAEKRYGTTESQMKQFMNALFELGNSFGAILIPALTELMTFLTDLVRKFIDMDEEQKKLIVTVASVAAAVGPVLLIFSKMLGTITAVQGAYTGLTNVLFGYEKIMRRGNFVSGETVEYVKKIPGLLTTLSASFATVIAPVLAIIAVIALLVGAFVTLWNTNEEFRNKITEIWNSVVTSVQEFTQQIVERINALGFDFQNITEVIKAIWFGFCDLLAPVFIGVFDTVASALQAVFDIIIAVFDIFIGLFTGDMDKVVDGFGSMIESVLGFAQDLLGNLLGILGEIGAKILEFFGFEDAAEKFRSFFDGLKEIVMNAGDIIKGIGETIATFFTETIPETFESVVTTVQGVVQTVIDFFTVTIPESFNSFVTTLGEIIQSVIDFFIVTIPEAFITFATVTVPEFIMSVVTFIQELPYKIGTIIGELLGKFFLFGANLLEWVIATIPIVIENIITFFSELPSKIWTWLKNAWDKIVQWGTDLFNKAKEIGRSFLDNIIEFFSQLPSKVWTWITDTWFKIVQWGADMGSKAAETARTFLQNIIEFFSQLPSKVWEFITNVFSKIVSWGADMKNKAKETGRDFLDNIIEFFSQLPSKVWEFVSKLPDKISSIGEKLMSAGEDIFNDLWDGIRSVADPIVGFVQGIADSIGGIIDGIIDGFNSVVSGADRAKKAAGSVKGSHANGLDYVPYNNYLANLHEGERVLTKQENESYNKGRVATGGDTFNFYNTEPNPYEYSRQMKKTKKQLLEGF